MGNCVSPVMSRAGCATERMNPMSSGRQAGPVACYVARFAPLGPAGAGTEGLSLAPIHDGQDRPVRRPALAARQERACGPEPEYRINPGTMQARPTDSAEQAAPPGKSLPASRPPIAFRHVPVRCIVAPGPARGPRQRGDPCIPIRRSDVSNELQRSHDLSAEAPCKTGAGAESR